jgi:hypothetical protein
MHGRLPSYLTLCAHRWAIKGVKGEYVPSAAGFFHAFQPTPFEQDCSCLPLRDFGTLLHFRSAFGFSLPAVFIISARRSQSVRRPSEPAELMGTYP